MKKLDALSVALLCLFLTHSLQALPYRTRNGGDWSTPFIWEVFNGAWGAATDPPGAADEVTIRGGHTVIILPEDAAAGFLHVENGAVLRLEGTARSLLIHDLGPAADFIVDGAFQDNASSGAGNGLVFSGSSTWQLGPAGTILRTNNSNATRYRDHYHGGMSNIPATAQWIVRYVGLGDPAFTTVNTFYPNLTFESVGGDWAPLTGFSQFTGASGTAVVKGNLDVGGAGAGIVTIVNENYNTAPISVWGNLVVRTGSTLTNAGDFAGTGLRVGGQVVVDGTLDLSAGTGLLHLNGVAAQNVAGSGAILLHDLEVNNFNGVHLQRPLTVGYDLSFFAGKVTLYGFDLTVNGEITGYAGSRYVQTNGFGPAAGALVRPASGSVVFPVGNNTFNLAIVEATGGQPLRVRVEDRVLEEGTTGNQLAAGLVNRTWVVEGTGGNPFSLTVQWNGGDQLSGFDPGQCYLAHYDNGWQSDGPAPASGNDPFLRTRTGLQNAFLFTVGSGGVLPIELATFHGRVVDAGVLLIWQTATELNNDYMAVERSGDGRAFTEVGRVAGAGTTYEPRVYEFLDEAPGLGVNYYRLRQADYDGTIAYHRVIAVTVEAERAELRVFPVPARHQLQVVLDDRSAPATLLQVVNSRGQVLASRRITTGETSLVLDISRLEPGNYFICLDGGAGPVRQFVKK